MKKIILTILLCLIAIPLCAGTITIGKKKSAAPSGQDFSDDFNRTDADSLGANWTEASGDTDIASNVMSFQTAGWDKITNIYSGQATDTVSQYVKVTFNSAEHYPAVILRYTNSLSSYYVISAYKVTCASDWTWEKYDSVADVAGTTIGATAEGAVASCTIGFTITGTGDNTVIRVWSNPTANSPVSASEWDSGDSTPDIAWTDNPGANAVDTGNYVGLQGGQGSAGDITAENFYGGDI